MSDAGSDGGFDDYRPPAALPDGVRKEVVKESDSTSYARPKAGDEVTVHYEGTLETDGTQFDSSRTRGNPITFSLGSGEVIKGWELAVPTMRKGEIAKFTLQPEFAYGEAGHEPAIPPSAVLIFEIELISWVAKDDLFNDGGAIKAVLQEGSGWKNPKKGEEICISLKVTDSDGSTLEEKTEVDYVIDSGELGELTKVVDKVLTGMLKGERCSVKCSNGYVKPSAVLIEIDLHEIYEISDVSFAKDKSVMKKTLKEGESHEKPLDGAKATLRIESMTDGATMVSGFMGSQALTFVCGDGDVCDALEAAVVDMKRGERALVTVADPEKVRHPSLGSFDVLPEKIVLTLELVDFEKVSHQWSRTNEDRLDLAAERKAAGAKLFGKKRFELALEKYSKVIEAVSGISTSDRHTSDEDKKEAAEFKRVAELNKAACYLQLGDNTKALSACNTVLKEDRDNVKALFRRAKAHYGRKEFAEALRDLERLLELDPNNKEAQALVPHARKAQKVADKESKGTFAKMCTGFGKIGSGREKRPEPEKTAQKEPEEERNMDIVTVTFRIEYKPGPGETVCVVGSPDALGAWDLTNALILRKLPQKWEPPVGSGREKPPTHFWEGTAALPQGEELAEYKYLIRTEHGDRVEGGSKHKVHLSGMGGTRQRCVDKWREEGE